MEPNEDLKDKIVGVLVAENCKNLSDDELDKILSRCAAGWILDVAKKWRDMGYLKNTDIGHQMSLFNL